MAGIVSNAPNMGNFLIDNSDYLNFAGHPFFASFSITYRTHSHNSQTHSHQSTYTTLSHGLNKTCRKRELCYLVARNKGKVMF